jgi:hypothetical protein
MTSIPRHSTERKTDQVSDSRMERGSVVEGVLAFFLALRGPEEGAVGGMKERVDSRWIK